MYLDIPYYNFPGMNTNNVLLIENMTYVEYKFLYYFDCCLDKFLTFLSCPSQLKTMSV